MPGRDRRDISGGWGDGGVGRGTPFVVDEYLTTPDGILGRRWTLPPPSPSLPPRGQERTVEEATDEMLFAVRRCGTKRPAVVRRGRTAFGATTKTMTQEEEEEEEEEEEGQNKGAKVGRKHIQQSTRAFTKTTTKTPAREGGEGDVPPSLIRVS